MYGTHDQLPVNVSPVFSWIARKPATVRKMTPMRLNRGGGCQPMMTQLAEPTLSISPSSMTKTGRVSPRVILQSLERIKGNPVVMIQFDSTFERLAVRIF